MDVRSLFDFIRKRINKTIKDASDAIPEEEMETNETDTEIEEKNEVSTEEKEITTDIEVSDDNSKNIEESEEDDKESDDDKEENKGMFSFFRRNKDSDKDDESKSSDEKSSEDIDDNNQVNKGEIVESGDADKSQDNDKEENKGMFSFFRRNKDSDKDEESKSSDEKPSDNIDDNNQVDKENVESIEMDEKSEEEFESVEKSKETLDTEDVLVENPPDNIENNEDKKEDKGRFGFFSRNKNKEASSNQKDEKEEDKSDDDSGRFSFITKKTIKEEDIEDILEELEFSLIEGDVAFDVAERIVESVKEDLIGKKIKRRGDMELFTTNALKKAITEIIDNGYYDLLGDIEKSKEKGEPYKIMFVGINGTGKTTTIAKIATYLEKHGYSSVFGASDTFRAGAIEQLEHHANNLNLKIIKHERNSDPAAVAFDAVEHAKASGKDVVLIDTSGRMQTNANLMDEMKKIKRVSQPDIVIYVGDALMGNDATEQASKFNEVIDIDGIILTKADADAKGGAAISIGHVIHKPILFIGTGQSYDDLMEFEPEWMINQIFNEEAEA